MAMADHFEKMDLHEVPAGTLARVLAITDGTIATILEAYVGEPVSVIKLDEGFEAGDSQAAELPVEPGERILRRKVLLQGAHSGLNFLHADCLMRADRLPEGVLDELLASETPLRRILTERRIGTFEEMIGGGREPAESCALFFGVDPSASMISRCYRILIDQEPVILITEKFPVERFS